MKCRGPQSLPHDFSRGGKTEGRKAVKGVADRFWEFFFYSFAGYLLEKGFARRTHASQQIRKGLLLLPLCPVYGLGMVAKLHTTKNAA